VRVIRHEPDLPIAVRNPAEHPHVVADLTVSVIHNAHFFSYRHSRPCISFNFLRLFNK
jgi:hypothetical protein